MVAFVGNVVDIGGVFVGDTEDIENVISDIQDIINYVPLHKVESVLERSLKLLKEQNEQLQTVRENFNRLVAKIAVQPEIILCKDCVKWDKSTMKHYEDVFSGSGDTAECRMFCDMDSWGEFTDDMRRTDGNWFCADGKRK